MESFKIYDELCENIDERSYTLSNENRATINNLSPEHRDIIYAIIIHHCHKHSSSENDQNLMGNDNFIPYKGKTGSTGKGITFDSVNLPLSLQKIIVKYLERVKTR